MVTSSILSSNIIFLLKTKSCQSRRFKKGPEQGQTGPKGQGVAN